MSKSHKNTSYKSEFSFLFFKDEHLSLNLLQLFLDFLRHGFFEASSYFQAQFLLKYHKKSAAKSGGIRVAFRQSRRDLTGYRYPDIFPRDKRGYYTLVSAAKFVVSNNVICYMLDTRLRSKG